MTRQFEQSEHRTAVAHRGRGWGADQIVRDHGLRPVERTGWSGRQWVRDHADTRVVDHSHNAGWSGLQTVKDYLDRRDSAVRTAGWSGVQLIKDWLRLQHSSAHAS